MRKLCISLVVLAFAANGADVQDMQESLRGDLASVVKAAAKATVERFPDADSVIVDDRIHTRFEPDGSDVTWDDEWVKVLTEKGRRAYASVSLDFNERYGDAGIFCVEIVGTNGVARAVDFAKTLKTATDNSSMGANIVDPLDKRLSCAVPGLAVGEIRHVRMYRRTKKARMRDTWADINLLEQTKPVLSTVVSVDQPAGRPVVHAVVRNPVGKTVVRDKDTPLPGGRTLLRWTARDVPQAFPEPSMPSFSRCAQGLRLSTIKDWPTVSRWYWSICEAHLAKTTSAMTNAVGKIVKGCADEEAKIRALFKFVSQEVRYMGLTLEADAPGYEPHDVNVTFDNRYGVCRDKAALLAAMLRIAGVRAFPVLIHAGAKMDPEVPMPYFNHAIVGVDRGLGRQYLLMDPTDESSKDLCPAYLSDKSYLVARPEGETLLVSPVTPVERNMMRVESTGALDADGALLLTTRLSFTGINDTAVRHGMLRKTPVERRRWMEGMMRGIAPGAELLSFELAPEDLRDTDAKLEAKTVVRFPGFVLRGRTRDTVRVPFLTEGFNIADGLLDENTALLKRRFPLELMCTAGAEETVRISLGAAVGAPVSMPDAVDARAGGAKDAPAYRFTRSVSCSGGALEGRRSMRISGVSFTAAEYAALRRAREETETAGRDRPAFASVADGDANVRIREESTELSFTSPFSWKETATYEREVLTYKGKKDASELKFTYAPCTRSVRLVSATVSNRNGRVFSVAPHEINEMDCSWAASAPRYPASRILVANLPGVEIGSVVRFVVEKTVTNAPVAYSLAYAFGGKPPTDFEKVVVTVPDGMDFKIDNSRFLGGDGSCLWQGASFSVATNAGSRTFAWTMREPPREPNEPMQPPASRWRPYFEASAASWPRLGVALDGALVAARAAGSAAVRRKAAELTKGCRSPGERLAAIRAHLAHNLRVTGPGLFELPFDRAFTAPDRVMAEGYGSDADRMNLAFTMMEAAGFDCSFVLATSDAHGFRRTEAERRAVPRPGSIPDLLLRAEWSEGWVPFCRERSVFWYGGENEYTPAECSSWHGGTYYDLRRDSFGRIDCGAEWAPRSRSEMTMEVRENGSVDARVRNSTYGASVGAMRKRFAEMLPELRSRFFQQMLGKFAQNAAATSDLETDVKGYPFTVSFSAYAADYAVARGDSITLELPAFNENVFGIGGSARRRSPIAVGGKDGDDDELEVVFPEGYTEIENIPADFRICNPLNPDELWLSHTATSRMEGGRLHVRVRRSARRPAAAQFDAAYHPYFRELNRRATSPEVRTITVRKRRK